jgi:adenine C2-methylase RlmN of 23S rRNA A2503 and tRNA A37
MLDGVNDRYKQALALAVLLEPRRAFKVNLIPSTRRTPAFGGSGGDRSPR